MYEELFNIENKNYEWQNVTNRDEKKNILNNYINKYYDANDDKNMWFEKMKLLADELEYASNTKDYKNSPDQYKGSIVDVSMVIRVALTTKSMTPDLYEIMKLLGVDEIKKRINSL